MPQTLYLTCSSEIFCFLNTPRCLDSLERFTFLVFTCSLAFVEMHCGKVEKLPTSLARATSKDKRIHGNFWVSALSTMDD